MISFLLERLCNFVAMWCATKGASHFIYRKGRLYLARFYLFGGDGEGRAPGWRGRTTRCLYLHHFFTSDPDGLHNHPWKLAWSIILTGGYLEWRKVPNRNLDREGYITMRSFMRRPGSINVIRPEDYHRAVLFDPAAGCWTLFYASTKTGKGWGFLDLVTGRFTKAGEKFKQEDRMQRAA